LSHLKEIKEFWGDAAVPTSPFEHFQRAILGDRFEETLANGLTAPEDWDPNRLMANRLGTALDSVMPTIYSRLARFVLKDIEKHALYGALALRLEWLFLSRQDSFDTTATGAIIGALAFNDHATAVRFCQLGEYPKSRTSPTISNRTAAYQAVVSDGLCGLLLNKPSLTAPLFQEIPLPAKPTSYEISFADCLVQIARMNPDGFAASLRQYVINSRKIRTSFKTDRVYCTAAQGIYALAKHVNPELVETFTPSGLPNWDADLAGWCQSSRNPIADLDLKPLCTELHETLIELQTPRWFRPYSAPVPTQAVTGSHTVWHQNQVNAYEADLIEEEKAFLKMRGYTE
jgi:hypothetical protein